MPADRIIVLTDEQSHDGNGRNWASEVFSAADLRSISWTSTSGAGIAVAEPLCPLWHACRTGVSGSLINLCRCRLIAQTSGLQNRDSGFESSHRCQRSEF